MAVESMSEIQPILIGKEQPNFVETSQVRDIISRATRYIQAGFPLHFSGPSGTGKTTIAMYLAAQIGQPVILMHGDEEFGTSDLVGGEHGYQRKKVVDNFIQSVLKSEESVAIKWIDNRLTVACKYGFTLIYDEFTRSRPEANNILLSVPSVRSSWAASVIDLLVIIYADMTSFISVLFTTSYFSSYQIFGSMMDVACLILLSSVVIPVGKNLQTTELVF